MVDAFDQFWAAYPRKVKKAAAVRAFRVAMTKTTIAVILTALAWQRRQPQWRVQRDGSCFIPYPATWLNGEQWMDEPPEGSGIPAPIEPPLTAEQGARLRALAESIRQRDYGDA